MQIGTHIGIPGLGASPSPGPLPPELTLDDSSGLADWAATFTQGGAAVALADSDTVITDPSEDGIDQLVVTGSGIVDGADEVITIGADTFPANADKSTTEVVGSTTFAIAYVASTKKWTITKDGGGPAPKADLESLIEAMDYENQKAVPTLGARTFTFVLTDGAQNSNSAVSTVTVQHQAPVIDAIADTTATVGVEKTIAPNNSGGPATSWSATGLSDGASINTSTGVVTWTPTVETTLNITITATNSGGSDDEAFAIAASDVPSIPTDSMESWFVLDEGTGTAIADSSGNGYTGTLNSETGAWGLTAQDGTDMLSCATARSNYVTTNVPFVNGSFSIVAVIMRTASATKGMIANHRQATSDFKGWYLFCENTNTIQLDIDAGASTTICSLEALPLGVPVIVIGTFNSSTGAVDLYLNDGRSASASGATLGVPSSSSFEIGINSGNTAVRWDGRIGDVIYYSKVLDASERSDIFANLWHKYYGTFSPSVSTPDTQLTVTKHALPNDGNTAENTVSLYTPLFATATYFYAAAIDLRPGSYSRLFQLNKSDYTQNALANISTSSINSQYGHRGSAVVVTGTGRVLVHGHGHQSVDGWGGMHSAATGEDISSMNATANPNSLTAASYHRMFINPVNGSCFAMERNSSLDTELYKWNDGTTSWDVVKAPLTQYFGGAASSYDAGLSFDASGNMYLTAQCNQVAEGYPRCCIGVAKSTDDGATWTDLAGNSITTPISESDISTAFPLSTTIGGDETDHDAEGCWTLVTNTGDILVFGGYRDEMAGDTYRKLYMAKWNATGKYFTRHVLADVGVDHGCFNGKTAWYSSGKIYLLYTDTDFHELANYPGGPYPDPGDTYLLVSDDDGHTWTRYLVDDGTGTFKCYEAYGCPTSLAEDGVIRIMPTLLDSFDSSDDACEIWEVTLPANPSAPLLSEPNTQYVARGQTINTVGITNTGGDGTYSANGLPAGLSCNSSTGDITGTVDAGATVEVATVEVTCTNGAGSDTATFNIDVRSSSTTISSADSFPYYLSTANELYLLTEDISADGIAFAMLQDNVVLDLQGHSVLYDNAAQPSFSDGDFATAGNWTFSANMSQHTDAVYAVGEVFPDDGTTTSLAISVPCADQETTHNSGVALEAGEWYTLKLHVTMPYDSANTTTWSLYVELDDGTNQHRASRPGVYTNRKMQLVRKTFECLATGTYDIKVGIKGADGDPSRTIYVSHIEVVRQGRPGIVTGPASWRPTEYWPELSQWNDNNYDRVITSSVSGGRIEQVGNSYESHAVFMHRAADQVITGVAGDSGSLTLLTRGAMSQCISALNGSGGSLFSDLTLDNRMDSLLSRDAHDGRAAGAETSGTYRRVRVANSPHIGIELAGGESTIDNCTADGMQTYYTNDFAFMIDDIGNGVTPTTVTIKNSTVDQGSGLLSSRGIMIDQQTANVTELVFGNTVTVQQLERNQEQSGYQQGGVYGIQVENATALECYENTVTVVGSSGGAACRLNPAATDVCHFHDNVFTATPDAGGDDRMFCLKCKATPAAGTTFEDETYRASEGFILLEGTGNPNLKFSRIHFEKITAAGVTFSPWWSDNDDGWDGIVFEDCTFEDATTKTACDERVLKTSNGFTAYNSAYVFQNTINVTLQNGSGTPHASTSIAFDDVSGTEVDNGTTDGSGQYSAVLKEWGWLGLTKTTHTPHYVRTGVPSFHRITSDEASKSVVLNSDESLPFIEDPGTQNETVGNSVSVQLTTLGGSGMFSLESGAFPNGVSMDSSGNVTGTITAGTGTFNPVVRCTGTHGYHERTLTFAVS